MQQMNEPRPGRELPGVWGEIHDRLRNERDLLDDAYVTQGNLRFRIGRLGELEQKHGVNLEPHRLVPVMGVPTRQSDGDPDLDPGAVIYDPPPSVSGTAGSLRGPAPDDLVPYLSVDGGREVFLDREAWTAMAGSLGMALGTFTTMLDNPVLLEMFVNHQISHKWGGDTRLLRMRRLGGGRRGAMRVRAILPDDYVRLDSVYLVPGIYRTLWELEGPRLDVGGVLSRLTPDAMLLNVRAGESKSMDRLNERFAVGMHIYNSEIDKTPPLEIEIIMVRLVCLNGMTVTEKGKFVSIQRRVHLGREVYPGLPPAELPTELQREIDDLVSQALRLSWAGAGGMTADVERQVGALADTRVPLETREEVRRAVSELALQTAMRFVPGVTIDRIVDAYYEEVEHERARMAEAPEAREAVIAGTAWGLYNAFTYYATHVAGERRLSMARSLHNRGRKFLGRIDWDRVRTRARPPRGGRRGKIYLSPPRI